MVSMQGDVEAQILGQAMVVTITEEIGIVSNEVKVFVDRR